MNVNSGDGFDQLLTQELQRAAGTLEGPNASAGQSLYHAVFTSGGTAVSVFSSITAAVTTKAAIAATAATIVVGGAAAGTLASGSANPTNWGSSVSKMVETCKSTVRSDSGSTTGGTTGATTTAGATNTAPKNVGQCVSAFAKTHGAKKRALHAQEKAQDEAGKPADRSKHHGKGQTGDAADQPEGSDQADSSAKPETAGQGHGRDASHQGGPPSFAGPHR